MTLQIVAPPTPPQDATAYCVDKKTENGWRSLDMPATGGRPGRWLPLPLHVEAIQTFWGGGTYRVHWRTGSKRSLGVSEPFVLPPLKETPSAAPEPPQRQAPQPGNGAGLQAELAQLVQLLAPMLHQQQAQASQYPDPCTDPLTMLVRMKELASHDQQLILHQYEANQAAALKMQEMNAKAASEMHERTVRLILQINEEHRERLTKIEADATAAIQSEREKNAEAGEDLRAELDELREAVTQASMVPQGQLQPSQIDDLIGLAKQVLGPIAQQWLAQKIGPQAAAAALPVSPDAPDGGSVTE